MIRTTCRRRVLAWGLILCGAVLFAAAQHRYVRNFVMGPFEVGQPYLDSVTDVTTAPRYFVKVTGSRALDTGVQQVTIHKRGGVETSRSVSAAYFALVVGDRLLVVKSAAGAPTTAEGELVRMPETFEGSYSEDRGWRRSRAASTRTLSMTGRSGSPDTSPSGPRSCWASCSGGMGCRRGDIFTLPPHTLS